MIESHGLEELLKKDKPRSKARKIYDSCSWWIRVGWINLLRYNLKYALQRLFKGWSKDEAWNLGYAICKRFIKPLKHVRATGIGYPHNLTPEEWDAIRDKIIFSFETYLAEDYVYKKDGSLDCEATRQRDKTMQEGFELFGKHFMDLWD